MRHVRIPELTPRVRLNTFVWVTVCVILFHRVSQVCVCFVAYVIRKVRSSYTGYIVNICVVVFSYVYVFILLVPVATRSKAYVCGRSSTETVVSKLTGGMMSVCCECCVLSGRGLRDKLITRPDESYRLRYVVVCDLETL